MYLVHKTQIHSKYLLTLLESPDFQKCNVNLYTCNSFLYKAHIQKDFKYALSLTLFSNTFTTNINCHFLI